jgi:hypothetical protein
LAGQKSTQKDLADQKSNILLYLWEGVGTSKNRTLKVQKDQNIKSAISMSKVKKIRTSKVSIKVSKSPKVTYLWCFGPFNLT